MEQIKEGFRSFLADFCRALEQYELPYRTWHQIEEVAESRQSFATVLRPDVRRVANLLRFRHHESIQTAQHLYDVIRTNPPTALASFFGPQADPLSRLPIDLEIVHKIINPFLEAYLSHANTFQFSDEEFEVVFGQLEDDWATDTVNVVERAPLLNVSLAVESPINITESSRITRAEPGEIESWLNPMFASPFAKDPGILESVGKFDAVLETSSVWGSAERRRQWDASGLRKHRELVIQLLRLLFDSRIVAPLVERRSTMKVICPFPYGTSTPVETLPNFWDPVVAVDSSMVSTILLTWEAYERSVNQKTIDTALRRWSESMDRTRREDELVDLWIGLESLFLPETSELQFRVALRVARLLGETRESRTQFRDNTELSYKWRSAIVHANQDRRANLEKKNDIRSICGLTHDSLRLALVRIIAMDSAWNVRNIDDEFLH